MGSVNSKEMFKTWMEKNNEPGSSHCFDKGSYQYYDMEQFTEKFRNVRVFYECGESEGEKNKEKAGAADTKAADDKACDALKDASADAITECKKWSGKVCVDDGTENSVGADKVEECKAAKASATSLVAGVIS